MIPRDLGVAAALGVLVVPLLLISHLFVRRRSSAAVRLALRAEDSGTRCAAILVAGRHGLARYRHLLVKRLRYEEADEVLVTLAEVVREYGCPGRGRRATLRHWSEWFLSEGDGFSSGAEEDVQRPSATRARTVAAIDEIDSLEVFEAVTIDGQRALPPGRTTGSLLPAQLWAASPGELDPLLVLASLEDRPRATTRSPAVRGHQREGRKSQPRFDHEAIVDRIAGLSPRQQPDAGGTRKDSPDRPRVPPTANSPRPSSPRRRPPLSPRSASPTAPPLGQEAEGGGRSRRPRRG